jgi:tetratricopeptide (TPR) repeat protein
MWRSVAVLAVAAFAAPLGAEPTAVRLQILSAVVKDQKIADASVILQKNGAQSATAGTDASGNARLTPAFSERDEGVLLLVKKDGYSTLVAKCPCDGMTYAISPVMNRLDGLRIVLNWGAEPADLDAHIVYPGNHIFWNAKTGRQANLDVDDRDSYGPETITIDKKQFGEKYVYAVHDYTDLYATTTERLSKSQAKVFVYIGQTLVRSYYVPVGKHGNLWVVFAIDGQGEFHDINAVVGAPVPPPPAIQQLDGALLARYLTDDSYVAPAVASTNAAGEARRLNKLGEQAYHAQQLDEAIDDYRRALELDAGFGQAYSNLGLAYQKAGRIAEAIWADRKAIALASGETAATVRASSYYNIARIYEQSNEWDDARVQFELAQKEKPGKVYTDAIARMKARLGR